MLKKFTTCIILTLFVFCGAASTTIAADAGPADIEINYEGGKKPAKFPHKKHQDAFACGECHHGMADGAKVPYVEGQEIQKCATCHTGDTLAGKTKDKHKLDTMKGAGHGNCLDCHKESKQGPTGCKDCHAK